MKPVLASVHGAGQKMLMESINKNGDKNMQEYGENTGKRRQQTILEPVCGIFLGVAGT